MEGTKDVIMSFLNGLIGSPFLYILTVLVILYSLNKGIFKLNIGGLQLGRSQEGERRIIAAQISYLTLETEAITNEMMQKFPNTSEYHASMALEKVLDEMVRRVIVNHISNEPAFIEDVYLSVIAIIRRYCKDEWFWTDEFKKYARDKITNMINHLLSIRTRMVK